LNREAPLSYRILWLKRQGDHEMEWSDETILRLRELWAEGHSTAEIGRRMGISKNAVVGKAHRLNLPPRPSPIRRQDGEARARPPAPRRVSGPTLPSLEASAPAEPPPAARPAPVLRPVPVSRSSGRTAACCWPIGEPGTSSFRFCDAEALGGKPYCAEHAQLAYVKVRDRREEAA
jgi:GcrA cell cycle regulator